MWLYLLTILSINLPTTSVYVCACMPACACTQVPGRNINSSRLLTSPSLHPISYNTAKHKCIHASKLTYIHLLKLFCSPESQQVLHYVTGFQAGQCFLYKLRVPGEQRDWLPVINCYLLMTTMSACLWACVCVCVCVCV